MKIHSKTIGLILGPALFVLALFYLRPEGLSEEGRIVLATTLWVGTWWISEVIPIAATALLPMVLFPLFGVLDINEVSAAYASPLIFLFMGGFMIAVTIEKWDLHRRIALTIISKVGSNLRMIILGVMLATGFLSMWISNTATAVMMMPIGVAVAQQLKSSFKDPGGLSDQIGKVLMFAIAYSCATGGLATLIGTPTNAVFMGIVDEFYDVQIGFAQWLAFGLPVSIILLLLSWYYLVNFAFDIPKTALGGQDVIRQQLKNLGKMTPEELRVLIVFIVVALSWIFRTFLQNFIPFLNDTIIAVIGALILFLIPSPTKKGEALLDWQTAQKIPWGILILFGGGLALAAGFKETGLAAWLGNQMTLLDTVPYFILLLVLITAVNFLTEITSNVATAAMILPVLGALALSLDVHPYGLMVAATMAASCAYMLPVATPPNAVVFASGYLSIPGMIKVGFLMNVISILLLILLVYFVLPLVWGIDLTSYPDALR